MCDWKSKYSPTLSVPLPSFLSNIVNTSDSNTQHGSRSSAGMTPSMERSSAISTGSLDVRDLECNSKSSSGRGDNSSEVKVAKTEKNSDQVNSKSSKCIVTVNNSKFDLNSWLTNKTFLSIIAIVVFLLILAIVILLISRSKNKTMIAANMKFNGNTNTNGNGNSTNGNNSDGEDTNNNSEINGSNYGKIAGIGIRDSNILSDLRSGSRIENSSGSGIQSLDSKSILKDLAKQKSDIKFILTQLVSHNQRMQHLENLLSSQIQR